MKKNLWPQEVYQKVKISDLILVSLYSLQKEKVGFEELAAQCFNAFPKKFELLSFPRWPDTRKLDRPLRSLRLKKMIIGGAGETTSLTSKGRKRAFDLMSLLRQRKLEI